MNMKHCVNLIWIIILCVSVKCDLSKFKILKRDGKDLDVSDFSQVNFPSVNVEVNVRPYSYFGCMFFCLHPEVGLPSEDFDFNGLQSNGTACYHFSHKLDGSCIVGLVSSGTSLLRTEIEDGEVVGLSEAGVSFAQQAASFEVGKLRHIQSALCVEPQGGIASPGVVLIFTSSCSNEHRLKWYGDGRIQHFESGLCMAPVDGSLSPNWDVFFALLSCPTAHRYQLTADKAIQMLSSTKCMHPWGGVAIEGKELIADSSCYTSDNPARIQFDFGMFDVGKLESVHTGRCVEPQGGVASPGVVLIFTSSCSNEHRLKWYGDGRVQHFKSGLCLAPEDGSMNPGASVYFALLSCPTSHRYQLTADKAIQMLSSTKCIHPWGGVAIEGKELIADSSCYIENNPARIQFDFGMFDVGKLRSVHTGRCVEPQGGVASPGVKLIFTSTCNNEHRLKWYDDGRIKHLESGLCMAPQDGSFSPHHNVYFGLLSCPTAHRYQLTADNAIHLLGTDKCMHPWTGTADEGKELIADSSCYASENPARIQFEFL